MHPWQECYGNSVMLLSGQYMRWGCLTTHPAPGDDPSHLLLFVSASFLRLQVTLPLFVNVYFVGMTPTCISHLYGGYQVVILYFCRLFYMY